MRRFLLSAGVVALALAALRPGRASAQASEPTPTPPAGTAAPQPSFNPTFAPILYGDFDYVQHIDPEEGYSGFQYERMRVGVSAILTPWASAVGVIETVYSENPHLLDGYVLVRPRPDAAFTLGYSKIPIFVSWRDEPDGTLAIPERSPVADSLWPGRSLGVEARLLPPGTPLLIYGWFGNGNNDPTANSGPNMAGAVRADVLLGRARDGSLPTDPWGLRLGAAAFMDNPPESPGIQGETVTGYVYYRPSTVTGQRYVTEAHAVGYAGPVRVQVEAGWSVESRYQDNGTEAASVRDQSISSGGVSTEIAWVLRGLPRTPGAPPSTNAENPGVWDGGAVEIAARFDRVDFSRYSRDVQAGGATGGAAALTWWATRNLALSASYFLLFYDVSPVERPNQNESWIMMLRANFRWN